VECGVGSSEIFALLECYVELIDSLAQDWDKWLLRVNTVMDCCVPENAGRVLAS
jgi:hypothetical protein